MAEVMLCFFETKNPVSKQLYDLSLRYKVLSPVQGKGLEPS